MNYYSSPFCPDDDRVYTSNGKMKISKLYYKMNPKRDPYNRILDIQNLFLSKCVSTNKISDDNLKNKKKKNLSDIKDINEYYNKINKNINEIKTQEENQNHFNGYSNFFQTSIKVNNENYKKKNMSELESKINNNINSNLNSNIFNETSSNNYNHSKETFNKPKILNHSQSHSQVLRLDKTYYKYPTLNKKIYVLNHKNKTEDIGPTKFSLSSNPSYFYNNNSPNNKNYPPFPKQNYLNFQFDFDIIKNSTLGQLKQYQMKEIQNRKKLKPFIY